MGECELIRYKGKSKCPVYGFYAVGWGMFMDTQGNQCALITNSYSPCKMEMSDLPPDWENCFFIKKDKNKIEKILANVKIFPKGISEGIPFHIWKEGIISQTSTQ